MSNIMNEAVKNLGSTTPQVCELVEETLQVSASEIVGAMSEYVVGYVNDHRGAEKYFVGKQLSESDVENYIEYLINLRLEQVSGKRGTAYRDVEVPTCIYPILESLGSYSSDEEGVYITPNGVNAAIKPANADDVVKGMRMAGFQFTAGLPFAKVISSDLIYRLSIKDGFIYASSRTTPVDPVTLLVRLFIDFHELNSLYGTYRYSLGSARMLGGALDALTRLGISGKAIQP